MSFSEFYIIGADFKDFQRGDLTDRQLMAEIVVVDKTGGESHNPLLYQLKSRVAEEAETGQEYRGDLFTDDHPFVYIGEVASIDRKNKLIYLTGDNILCYKYLIVASGLCQDQKVREGAEELSPALHALFDALKMRRHGVLPSFVMGKNAAEPISFTLNDFGDDHQDIDELVHSVMERWDNKPPAAYVVCEDKCLFEVQV